MRKINSNDVASIRAGIKSVVGRTTTLQDDIQKVAYACLEHTKLHGDWTLSVELIEGISQSKGVKSSKITQYTEAFMGATYTYNEDTERNEFVYDEGRSAKDINLEQAALVKWYEFKGQNSDRSKTLDQLAEQLFKGLKASVKSGKVEETTAQNLMDLVQEFVLESMEAENEDVDAALEAMLKAA